MFGVQNDANNFGYSAGLLANTIANRPIRAALGTLFVSTDTLLLYRWTGSAWVEISGGGGTITGAFNGCQEQANEIGLGGELSEATDIITKDFPISFYADTTATARFSVTNDAVVSELATFTSLSPFNDGGVYIGNAELAGTIQAKSYSSAISTELRLNYDGGSIQLGNSSFGMQFNDGTPVINTTYSGNDIGLNLNFANAIYQLGDFNNVNAGTFLKINDNNLSIRTYFGDNEIGLSLNYDNSFYWLGDYNAINNNTYIFVDEGNRILLLFGGNSNNTNIQIDDNDAKINFTSQTGSYNFANVPAYANNAAAITGGLSVGDIYRGTTGGGDTLHIVH